ncbi:MULTISPECIES: formamidopyrimidine-DNA glycosylase [Sanguibacteroides]|uniref:Formamidopyrimidine-DNA glycosylase n=1 Tax=Sanguibacteroides justesenii TaxID=1547597 RepID=A0A0C3RFM0_9PORP|nr:MULTISPECIES: formamidopyrimidine-DNA glycosylase [Sanguibacteroides]KIO44089.1 formamidopyrimidine-DNA glycosylase [Sanguibacteroides justesenii]PXZ43876.1 endonuclease VIII [Sanguibacteroides justesenii]
MIEAPEALCLAEQLNRTIKGKRVTDLIVKNTPHRFTFFYGDTDEYEKRLFGKTVRRACAFGGMVEICAEDIRLVYTDGVNLRYYGPGERLPSKHQLLVGFEDQSCIIASVRMYGGIWCFPTGDFEGSLKPYYESAKYKPQVMTDTFDISYFMELLKGEEQGKKSIKAFLATGQTIPGLGNGVLQDILYHARIHPRSKVSSLSFTQKEGLFEAIKVVLSEMYCFGGRSTETDLFGKPGGYISHLSKATLGSNCLRCGEMILKENYMGGSIYYCPGCQKYE